MDLFEFAYFNNYNTVLLQQILDRVFNVFKDEMINNI